MIELVTKGHEKMSFLGRKPAFCTVLRKEICIKTALLARLMS
jgi:hypothetical protein